MRSSAGQLLRTLPALGTDAVIVLGSYAAALALRFDGSVPNESWQWFAFAVPLIALGFILSNALFGVYRTAWQYGSIPDAVFLGVSVALVTLVAFGINLMLDSRPIPLSVNLISGALIFLFMGSVKLAPRLLLGTSLPFFGREELEGTQRVLIMGAGNSGQMLAREMQKNRQWRYRPVAFVDDDRRKRGLRIHGVRVGGDRYEIPALVEKHRVDLVALAVPSAGAASIHELLSICEAANVSVRLVPALPDIVAGRASATELREVTVEELVARDPVDLDVDACRAAIRGKSVLITGAAGSIGAELARRLLPFEPASLHLFDASEGGLHELRLELMPQAGECQVRPWLGSIGDRKKVTEVFGVARPQVVFHCAAYKHVPLMEEHPDQALKVNVLGTWYVLEEAQRVGADTALFMSSQTAVGAASVMGASKRTGELIVKALAGRGRAALASVRLANVIDSRGGVVTTFWRQIQKGGPVSVTHPDVARYFLTVHEVASLLIQVAAIAGSGRAYVLSVGEEIRIADLAERMIRSGGMEPGRDVQIVYTGLRPGDKIREDLIGPDETLVETSHPKIFEASGPDLPSPEALLQELALLESQPPSDPRALVERLQALARIDRSLPRTTTAAPTRRDA